MLAYALIPIHQSSFPGLQYEEGMVMLKENIMNIRSHYVREFSKARKE